MTVARPHRVLIQAQGTGTNYLFIKPNVLGKLRLLTGANTTTYGQKIAFYMVPVASCPQGSISTVYPADSELLESGNQGYSYDAVIRHFELGVTPNDYGLMGAFTGCSVNDVLEFRAVIES